MPFSVGNLAILAVSFFVSNSLPSATKAMMTLPAPLVRMVRVRARVSMPEIPVRPRLISQVLRWDLLRKFES